MDVQVERRKKLAEIFHSLQRPREGENYPDLVDYWLVKVVGMAGIPMEYASSYYYGTRAGAIMFGESHPTFRSDMRQVSAQRSSRAEILAQLVARQREMDAMRLVLEMGQ